MRCDVETTVIPMPRIRLFHSKRKCERFLKKRGYKFNPLDGRDAQTWIFEDSNGNTHAVVYYNTTVDVMYAYDISLLTHEAVHIALATFRAIGEESPAEEEQCYVVQAIVHALVEAHFRWKEKKIAAGTSE